MFSTFLAASQDEEITSRIPLQDLTVAYWVCISLAALISLVSVGYKAYEWYGQLRLRIRAARDTGIDTEPARREALLAKIAAAKKTCTQHIVAFLVAVFEDAPMGTLTVIFTVRMYDIPIAVMLSLVTTCIMLGMKLNKLTLLKYWYAIALLCRAAAAGQIARMPMPRGRRWDKMGHWKRKLNDDEMTDAVTALNGPGTRAVADIEAELECVAHLLSALPTNVQPGVYASALEAHLSSVSSVLQLELEQKLQAPGATGTHHSLVSPRRPAARWRWASCSSPFDRQSLGHWPAWQLPSLRFPTPIPPASRRGAQPTAAEYGPASGIARSYSRWHACNAGSRLACGFRAACHAAEAAPTLCFFFCREQPKPRGISSAPDGCAAS